MILDLDIPVELAYEILWEGKPLVILDKDTLIEDKLRFFGDLNDLKIKHRITYIDK